MGSTSCSESLRLFGLWRLKVSDRKTKILSYSISSAHIKMLTISFLVFWLIMLEKEIVDLEKL